MIGSYAIEKLCVLVSAGSRNVPYLEGYSPLLRKLIARPEMPSKG